MSSDLLIAGISDASLGYGSPQIPAFMRSLMDYYGARSRAIVLEPDDPSKPPRACLYPDLDVSRVGSREHPYSPAGRIDYIAAAARCINAIRPDVLAVFCTFSLPVLFYLKYKPRTIIYYSIESISMYGYRDILMNRQAARMIDLVVFPEENRAALDLERCGFHKIPLAIVYNCSDQESQLPDSICRNGRFLNQGTIAAEHTFADYYLRTQTQEFGVDLYGPIVGREEQRLRAEFKNLKGNVQYKGIVDLDTLMRVRRFYSYSIVNWNPSTERGLYAPSNKFFEAISDSVPPITAPHPQHKALVERYRCGIVMRDWSYESFYRALLAARAMYGTDQYDEMIEGCKLAVKTELNWPKQFSKVSRILDAMGK